jgi:hypothetical protein
MMNAVVEDEVKTRLVRSPISKWTIADELCRNRNAGSMIYYVVVFEMNLHRK